MTNIDLVLMLAFSLFIIVLSLLLISYRHSKDFKTIKKLRESEKKRLSEYPITERDAFKLDHLFEDRSQEQISAFAYNIGRGINDWIKIKLKAERIDNRDLEAKLLCFFSLLNERILSAPTGEIRSTIVTINTEFCSLFGIPPITDKT